MLKRSHSTVMSLRPADITKTLTQFTVGLILQQTAWGLLSHTVRAVV